MKLFLLLLLASIPMFSQNIYYPLSAGREWKYQMYGIYGDTAQVETKSLISYEKKYDAYRIKHLIHYGKKDPWSSFEFIKEVGTQIIFLARTPNSPEYPEYRSFNDYIHIDPNFNMNSKSLPPIKVNPDIYIPENEILLDSNMTINYKWLVKDTELHRITREVIDILTVTVKAGTFNNVLKIKMIDSNKHRSEINIHYEYYAPNVGLIKEEFSSSHFGFRISLSCELLSYSN
jgi:hypothetical protein